MERIASADERIVTLAAALTRPVPVRDPAPASVEAPVVVDPRAALEAERRRVLDAAQEEGREAGLRDADATIEQRAAEAEKKIREMHAAETERLTESRERLARLLHAVPDAVADLETQVDEMVVEVAFAAVTRVLGELAAERTLVAKIAAQVLGEYKQRPATLRVAMDDVELLQDLADGEVRIVGDADFAPGECRVETTKGRYQSGLASRLDAIKQAFLASLEGDAQP